MFAEAIIYLTWAASVCLVTISIARALRHEHPLLHRGNTGNR